MHDASPHVRTLHTATLLLAGENRRTEKLSISGVYPVFDPGVSRTARGLKPGRYPRANPQNPLFSIARFMWSAARWTRPESAQGIKGVQVARHVDDLHRCQSMWARRGSNWGRRMPVLGIRQPGFHGRSTNNHSAEVEGRWWPLFRLTTAYGGDTGRACSACKTRPFRGGQCTSVLPQRS